MTPSAPLPPDRRQEDLRRWYRQSLSGRVTALEAARAALAEGSAEAVPAIRRVAHQLRGSGATYGFAEITAAAAAVEDSPDAAIEAPLSALLVLLRTAGRDGDDAIARILIVDDDPAIAHLVAHHLEGAGRKIIVVDGVVKAERILEEEPPNLIVLDLILADGDGRSFLAHLRKRPSTASVPVLVLSAKGGGAVKAEAYALGAHLYLEKPFDPPDLAGAVAALLSRAAETERESRQDHLTGLPNRAAFVEAFDRARAAAVRTRTTLAVAIFDLDRFKNVNDAYGHAVGDEVLRRLADVVQRSIRKADLVARWGGEEFVALFPETDPSGAAQALRKALDLMRAEEFRAPDGRTFRVTFSAGVSPVAPTATVEEAVVEADRLLYAAKSAGRDRVLSPDDKVRPQSARLLLAEDEDVVASLVAHRLGRDGFEVHRVRDGVEALRAAETGDYALALIDIQMPGMDGFELLGRIRKIPRHIRTPVVMLTSAGAEAHIARAFSLGANDYVTKPFSTVELTTRVHRLLKRA